jgi:CopA family copper-resistance protein
MRKPSYPLSYSRRRFLKFAAGAGFAGFLPAKIPFATPASANIPPFLEGQEFDLTIAKTPINITGKSSLATSINGQLPGPTLRMREGDEVTIRVKNLLDEETSLHWHGLILPYQMDGAPDISFPGIAPGETFTYRFNVRQSGTYWYHSHSGMQEQTGLYGAIVISPTRPTPAKADRDYVIVLSDWTDENPERVFAKLKTESAYYNQQQPTLSGLIDDITKDGISETLASRHMWNMMRMNRTDLADISGMTYTYLLNGQSAAQNWLGLFQPHETIRLRFINAAAQSFFDVRIPGLKMTVVAADGQAVEPVEIDEFRIGLAETYDVLVTPGAMAYAIFAQAMDRSGAVYGTLATAPGIRPSLPVTDKLQPLEMRDMMGNMTHDGHEDMQHDGHKMSAHGQVMSHHAATEFGANVDMRVDSPRTNIDDPGAGLRGNGRRVLTYADLHTTGGPLDKRPPNREIEMHLTGNMQRYMWSFDGIEYDNAETLHFHYGERLRVILVNDTMMAHPVHLHGMWSELENEHGEFQVRKHTVVVQPAQRLTFLVTADALGRWPWHCHLFYHMHAGMFRDVLVS